MSNYLAQGSSEIYNPFTGPVGEGGGVTWFGGLIPAVVSLLMTIGAVVFVLMFVWGGIQWIIAGGDKSRFESAKQTLTNAIIGVSLLLLTLLILAFVECFFGIGLRSFNIGPFQVEPASSPVCTGITSGGGGGGGGGDLVGNANCPGCITGGCGITGEVYLGDGSQNYRCTSSGWVATGDAVTSTTCGTCP